MSQKFYRRTCNVPFKTSPKRNFKKKRKYQFHAQYITPETVPFTIQQEIHQIKEEQNNNCTYIIWRQAHDICRRRIKTK